MESMGKVKFYFSNDVSDISDGKGKQFCSLFSGFRDKRV